MHDRHLRKLLFRFMILLQIQPLSPLLPLPYFFFFLLQDVCKGKGPLCSQEFQQCFPSSSSGVNQLWAGTLLMMSGHELHSHQSHP